MKIKKIVKGVIVGAAMLALTSSAFAEDINIWGSSAQFNFWSITAPTYLTSKGCVAPTGYTGIQCGQTDSKDRVIWAVCSGVNTYVRVSSEASFDGLCALENDYPQPVTAGAPNGINPNCTTAPTGAPNNTYRAMSNPAGCTTWATCDAVTGQNWGSCSGTETVQVNVGSTDVYASSFVQQSHGLLSGPLGGAQTDRNFLTYPVSITAGQDYAPTTLTGCNAVVVPFAFYLNNTVKKNGVPVTNLSRMEIIQIYEGQAYNWTDLGSNYTASLPIVACLRHAGSGTHATLDLGVLHESWTPGGLVTTSCNNNLPSDPMCTGAGAANTPPTVFFNNGSSDEANCVNGKGTWSGAGAIGYIDADYILNLSPAFGGNGTYGNMYQVMYNGEVANAFNIENGVYDNFFSDQHVYYQSGADSFITGLCSFAQNEANIPTAEATWWATDCQMTYTKATDNAYPGYTGSSCTQTP
jgi:hypothetical protein